MLKMLDAALSILRNAAQAAASTWNRAYGRIDARAGAVKLPIAKYHAGERWRVQYPIFEGCNAAHADSSAANSAEVQRITHPMRLWSRRVGPRYALRHHA